MWDRFDVQGLQPSGEEMTLKQFLDYFKVRKAPSSVNSLFVETCTFDLALSISQSPLLSLLTSADRAQAGNHHAVPGCVHALFLLYAGHQGQGTVGSAVS